MGKNKPDEIGFPVYPQFTLIIKIKLTIQRTLLYNRTEIRNKNDTIYVQ